MPLLLPAPSEEIMRIPTPVRKSNGPKAKRPGRAKAVETKFIMVWWHLQHPYYAVYESEIEAHADAAVRNGLVIELRGSHVQIDKIEDYWRRDEKGKPMPAEFKGLGGY